MEIRKEVADGHQTLNYVAVIPTLNHLLWRHPVSMSLIMLKVANEWAVSTPQNAKHARRRSSSSIRKNTDCSVLKEIMPPVHTTRGGE